MFLCTSIWWFLISYIGHYWNTYSLIRSFSYIIVPIVPGGVNQLNINYLGPEQSLFHIVPHCSGPKWLIFNGLNVFHGGDRNNGTMVSPTFLGGPVEIFAKTQWNKGFINFCQASSSVEFVVYSGDAIHSFCLYHKYGDSAANTTIKCWKIGPRNNVEQ